MQGMLPLEAVQGTVVLSPGSGPPPITGRAQGTSRAA